MKRLILLCIVLIAPAFGTAQIDTSGTLKELDAYLDKTARQMGDSPFATVVSKNGDILYESLLLKQTWTHTDEFAYSFRGKSTWMWFPSGSHRLIR